MVLVIRFNHGRTKTFNGRKVVKRQFYNPNVSTKTIFMDKVLKKTKTKKKVKTTYLKPEMYTKDTKKKDCKVKVDVNTFLASNIKDGDKCIILDGSAAKSTSEILKKVPGVSTIEIPNFSNAYHDLNRRFKKNDKVSVIPVTLYDFLASKTNCTPYDIMYLDTCGYFYTSQPDDLKSCVEMVFRNDMLKYDGGIIGLTVCKRGSNIQWELCEKFFKFYSHAFTKIYEVEYGTMKTVFFKQTCSISHKCCPNKDLVWKLVGEDNGNNVRCDQCMRILRPCNATFCCEKCGDYDICTTCYFKH